MGQAVKRASTSIFSSADNGQIVGRLRWRGGCDFSVSRAILLINLLHRSFASFGLNRPLFAKNREKRPAARGQLADLVLQSFDSRLLVFRLVSNAPERAIALLRDSGCAIQCPFAVSSRYRIHGPENPFAISEGGTCLA